MFESEFHFFGVREDQLIEIIDDVFEGLWAVFIDLDNLTDNRSVERFILHLAKEREQLLNFLFHT